MENLPHVEIWCPMSLREQVFYIQNNKPFLFVTIQINPPFLLFEYISDEHFFWNVSYLDEFIRASDSRKDDVPSHAYFSKIKHFIDAHYIIGELFFEYRKGSCGNGSEGKM